MNVDLFTASGTKKGTLALPASMFEAAVNRGLMHLALVRQQSNRRAPIAHVKHRGEVVGSTKKMYQQKHTGNARRGPIRSPLLKGGGKAFGPRSEANFTKDMPKKMRRAALFSCLSYKAKTGHIVGLESYPNEIKTKTLVTLLKKLPVEYGRKVVLVTAGSHRGLELSARNVHNVKTLHAQYLNPEDILGAKLIVFLADSVPLAEKTFASAVDRSSKKLGVVAVVSEEKKAEKAEKAEKKAAKKPLKENAKKAPAPKKPSAKKKAA